MSRGVRDRWGQGGGERKNEREREMRGRIGVGRRGASETVKPVVESAAAGFDLFVTVVDCRHVLIQQQTLTFGCKFGLLLPLLLPDAPSE